ncbi:hypothetical protein B0H16DRAFT_1890699 [Mycena metata]|uniref:Uncharacterized protein n=1 Tax=Mycena metata TaxID=1033252 RepID=A0AAD7IDU4_9AGAR|nr:hypothetical protein B0H16DRAFT_1890699 [Mycena metata]
MVRHVVRLPLDYVFRFGSAALSSTTLLLLCHRVELILPVRTLLHGPLRRPCANIGYGAVVHSLALGSGSSSPPKLGSPSARRRMMRTVSIEIEAVREVEAMRGRGGDIRGRRGFIELPPFSLFQHAEPGAMEMVRSYRSVHERHLHQVLRVVLASNGWGIECLISGYHV